MKHVLLILFLIFLSVVSCDKPVFEKPEHLIKESKMIEMLVDIHIAEATFNNRKYQDSLMLKTKSDDFYYSVLNKYKIADSVFEKSYVFYAGDIKNFEKIYNKVQNRIELLNNKFSNNNNEEINLNNKSVE